MLGSKDLNPVPGFEAEPQNTVQGPCWSLPQIWKGWVWGCNLTMAGAENDFPSHLLISAGN